MAAESAGKTPRIPGETLSDRDLLLHLLQHAEHVDGVITDIAAKVGVVHQAVAEARPLLDRYRRLAGGVRMPWQG